MFLLPALRNARQLTRLVLMWLVLFIGVAVASPLVNPEGVQLVCTSKGNVKLIQTNAHGEETQNGLHCPICLPMAAVPVVSGQMPLPVGLTHALSFATQARKTPTLSLPWQARAPPSFS